MGYTLWLCNSFLLYGSHGPLNDKHDGLPINKWWFSITTLNNQKVYFADQPERHVVFESTMLVLYQIETVLKISYNPITIKLLKSPQNEYVDQLLTQSVVYWGVFRERDHMCFWDGSDVFFFFWGSNISIHTFEIELLQPGYPLVN
jgi:hypothetical protein